MEYVIVGAVCAAGLAFPVALGYVSSQRRRTGRR
jgi:hypothetical protein